MVVPSMKAEGGLVVAPISRNINTLLETFAESVAEIFEKLYHYTGTLGLVHYYNYLDFEDIHNVYSFKTEDDKLLNFTLLYNTVSRSWRIYVFESERILRPYEQDATNTGTLITLTPCEQRILVVAEESFSILPCIQFLKYDIINVEDFYIGQESKYYPELTEALPDASEIYDHKLYSNYQI